jgi:hypothetical protein
MNLSIFDKTYETVNGEENFGSLVVNEHVPANTSLFHRSWATKVDYPTTISMYLANGHYEHTTLAMVNHSFEPTCYVDDDGHLRNFKDLLPGDEVTIDYTVNEPNITSPFIDHATGKLVASPKTIELVESYIQANTPIVNFVPADTNAMIDAITMTGTWGSGDIDCSDDGPMPGTERDEQILHMHHDLNIMSNQIKVLFEILDILEQTEDETVKDEKVELAVDIIDITDSVMSTLLNKFNDYA